MADKYASFQELARSEPLAESTVSDLARAGQQLQ